MQGAAWPSPPPTTRLQRGRQSIKGLCVTWKNYRNRDQDKFPHKIDELDSADGYSNGGETTDQRMGETTFCLLFFTIYGQSLTNDRRKFSKQANSFSLRYFEVQLGSEVFQTGFLRIVKKIDCFIIFLLWNCHMFVPRKNLRWLSK